MSLDYTVIKYKDKYTIKNVGVTTLTYDLKEVSCDFTKIVKNITILPGKSSILPLDFKDNQYKIIITDSVSSETLDPIFYFNNTLKSFIESTKKIVCKSCEDVNPCMECSNDCETHLSTILKAFSYNIASNDKYLKTINKVSSILRCNIIEEVTALLSSEIIHSKTDTYFLYKKIIGIYYYAYYLQDIAEATDIEEKDYIDNKYDIVKILNCLRKIGIFVNKEEFFSEVKIYYWQLEDINKNITDVIFDITDNFLLTKDSKGLLEFEQGVTIVNTKVSRMAFAIKNALSTNYIIENELGNDITYTFNKHYDNVLGVALFVTKEYQTFGNILLKIKTI